MAVYRATVLLITSLLTIGGASAALACCDGGYSEPLAYGVSSCGGCGGVDATLIAPAPIAVGGGCGGCGYAAAPVVTTVGGCGGCGGYAAASWGGWGGGCGGCGGYAAASWGGWGGGCGGCGQAVVAVVPSPIYVINQGPNYTGPGIVVPYRTYTPSPYVGAVSAPYIGGYHRHFYPGPGYAYRGPGYMRPRFWHPGRYPLGVRG